MKDFWIRFALWFLIMSICLACGEQYPHVHVKTEMGNIQIEIYEKQAPITASNFLRYVDEGLFEGGTFYRTVTMDNQPDDSVKIDVIQGGMALGRADERKGFAPIVHETTEETGVLHEDGVISMARAKPGSATSEFFICIGDQPELDFGGKRNPDGQGFAAFGRVVEGMDVVKKIHRQPVEGQRLNPPVKILNIVRHGNS